MSCCEKCHFEEEEKHILDYLQPDERRTLLLAHVELLAMPKGPEREAAVQAHARWEDQLFPLRLPPKLATYFITAHHMMLPYELQRDAQLVEMDRRLRLQAG
jgi:hypothetical protein